MRRCVVFRGSQLGMRKGEIQRHEDLTGTGHLNHLGSQGSCAFQNCTQRGENPHVVCLQYVSNPDIVGRALRNAILKREGADIRPPATGYGSDVG